MRKLLSRLVRSKPLHFGLGGLLLYLLIDPAGDVTPVREPVTVGPQAIEQLSAAWSASVGRQPSAQELEALVARERDDEILFREALGRGLHERDPVVRQRLALNMRFLGGSPEASEESLVAQALAMDMHRSDLVVRRRLVQLMEFALADGAEGAAIGQEELAAMYAEKRAEMRVPARWRLVQVYFSAARRGEQAREDALAAAGRARAEGLAPAEAVALGDPFLGGHELPLLSAVQLAGQFGNAFAEALPGCAPQAWCAPVPSGFGQHAVWVEEYRPEEEPGLEDPEVRRRLEADVRRRRGEERLAAAMAGLRRAYGAGP